MAHRARISPVMDYRSRWSSTWSQMYLHADRAHNLWPFLTIMWPCSQAKQEHFASSAMAFNINRIRSLTPHFAVILRWIIFTCWTFARLAIHLHRQTPFDLCHTNLRWWRDVHFCKSQDFDCQMNWIHRGRRPCRPTNNATGPVSEWTFVRCKQLTSEFSESTPVSSLPLELCHIVNRIRWWTIAHTAGIQCWKRNQLKRRSFMLVFSTAATHV